VGKQVVAAAVQPLREHAGALRSLTPTAEPFPQRELRADRALEA
jgi:hypothetical protein